MAFQRQFAVGLSSETHRSRLKPERLRGSEAKTDSLLTRFAEMLCIKSRRGIEERKKEGWFVPFFLLSGLFSLCFLSAGCLLPVNTFSISDTALLSVSGYMMCTYDIIKLLWILSLIHI